MPPGLTDTSFWVDGCASGWQSCGQLAVLLGSTAQLGPDAEAWAALVSPGLPQRPAPGPGPSACVGQPPVFVK